MLDFYTIGSIAKYERRILLRSWFFRIFAILSLFVIGMYSGIVLFDRNPFTWTFRSLPTALLYNNMFLLNIFQSIIAVFLASDFLKRDKKLDTSEVLFIRPMSNFEYLTGKTLGLLSVFVILNLLVIILTSIFLLASDQVAFQFVPILWYFFLMSLPTLVFIIGLSFALMTILQNQSITFILLLGYIALILFYLADKSGYLFDYMAFKFPMAYSDIIGFGDWNKILLHRGTYFVTGIGFMLFTIWRLKRKPNKAISNVVFAIATTVVLVVSAFGFWIQSSSLNGKIKERKEFAAVSSANFNQKIPLMRKASINIEVGNKIKAQSKMSLRNKNNVPLDTLLFSINPGFTVEKVTIAETELQFKQETLLVKVVPTSPLGLNEDIEITMFYSGIPDFDVAYLDGETADVYGYESASTLKVDHRYGFYNSNYVLLTKELLWYPVPGVAYDPLHPAVFRQQFTRFDLAVTTKKGMLPVSQGERETSDSLTFHFSNRDPLPQISLAIAKFKEKTVDIKGIKIALDYIEGHDFFKKPLSALGDTTVTLITEFLDDYERPLQMYYPYTRFNLVETPVQFNAQPHSWTSTLASSQPQMVFFPELGFNVRPVDFNSSTRRIKRDGERNKEGLSEKEIQARVFTNFLKSVFASTSEEAGFGPGSSSSVGANPYSIFPNYFYYVNYITSDECPVLNYAFESYLVNGDDDPRSMFRSQMNGISDDEKANIQLKGKSLKQIIAEEDDKEAVSRVLKVKGAYLLTYMEKQTSGTDFNKFLLDYLYNNSYKEIKYSDLAGNMASQMNIDMNNFITDWYNATSLPSFGFGEIKVYEVIGKSQVVYVAKTKVTNFSIVPGLVKYTFQMGAGGGFGPFGGGGGTQSDPEDRIFLIEGNQTKELQIVLSESPRSVIINTLVSENIPSKTMVFGLNTIKEEKIAPEELETISDKPVELDVPGDLVTDNTEDGFSSFDPAQQNPIRKMVAKWNKEEESKFVGQGFGPPPNTWSLSANSDYFGKTEHSAYVVRSGEGTKTATWKKKLPEAAYYDVYVWQAAQRRFGPRRGGPDGGNNDPEGKFIYTVHHDDGVDKIEIEVKDFESGWNLLGSFYISADTAVVSLSDAGGADRVVADAVKWVPQH